MHKDKIAFVFGVAGIFTLMLCGCSKSQSGAVPVELTKIPATMNKAFGGASGETQQSANDYVSALQGNDPAIAFQKLQSLAARADLTAEQRRAAAQAMPATFQQLRQAADAGNAQAKAVMHQYITTR